MKKKPTKKQIGKYARLMAKYESMPENEALELIIAEAIKDSKRAIAKYEKLEKAYNKATKRSP